MCTIRLLLCRVLEDCLAQVEAIILLTIAIWWICAYVCDSIMDYSDSNLLLALLMAHLVMELIICIVVTKLI